jgi:ABC-type sugar transport system substrate-binding protein
MKLATTRRVTVALAAVATATLMLAGCSASGGTSGGDDQIRIGALYLDSQGYYGGVKAGVAAAAEDSGLDVKFLETTSAGDVSKESTFMNTLVSSGVDAIIISAVSTEGSIPAIKQAYDAGIPVICYNTCVTDEATDKYVTAYILGDPIEFGKQLGENAVSYFTEAGIDSPKMGVINCEQYEVCQQRLKGFEDALTAGLPGAKIVANQEGAEVDKAVPTAEQMLSANPDLDGIYGEAGGATVGAFKAVGTRDLIGKVAVFGSDMTTEIATELESGEVLKSVVDISGLEVGKLAFSAAQDGIAGNAPAEKIVAAPITLFTPDMAAEWLSTHPDGLP